MADADIRPVRHGIGFSAVLANLTGSGVTTVDGDWLTPMNSIVPTGYCIEYTEDTTPTSITVGWEFLVPGDANEYIMRTNSGGAVALSFATTGKFFIPFVEANDGGLYDFSGVSKMKPVIVATGGAGGASAVLKVTIVGRMAGATR